MNQVIDKIDGLSFYTGYLYCLAVQITCGLIYWLIRKIRTGAKARRLKRARAERESRLEEHLNRTGG